MNRGKMREIVVFQKRVDGGDPLGDPVDNWEDVVTVRAAVSSKPTSEKYEGNVKTGKQTVILEIDRNDDIVETMRAVYNGRYWDVRPPYLNGVRTMAVELGLSS
jgi:SPP1 family predicted phage head-tail adaptor